MQQASRTTRPCQANRNVAESSEGNGWDTTDAQPVPGMAQRYTSEDLLQIAKLMQVTLREDGTLESMTSRSPPPIPRIASAGVPANRQKECSNGSNQQPQYAGLVIERQNLGSMYESQGLITEACPEPQRQASVSGLSDTLYEDLSEEVEQYIRDQLNTGLRLDATEVLRNIVELIMSAEILRRCTNDKNIVDRDKVEKRLKDLNLTFSDYNGMLLDLLLEIEQLDIILSELEETLSFDGKQQDFLTATACIEEALKKIGESKRQKKQTANGLYISAAEQFLKHEKELTQAAVDNDDQYKEGHFQSLQHLLQALKYGAMHEIIESMNMEMKKLANGKLNGFLFYPLEDEARNKKRHGRPPIRPKLARTIEDAVDLVDGSGPIEESVADEIIDSIKSLSALFFSSYKPELGILTDSGEEERHYVKCDISKAMKLVSSDYKSKHLKVVFVHEKAMKVLRDYKRLRQDNGSLREELEQSQNDNDDLRKNIDELRKENDDLKKDIDDLQRQLQIREKANCSGSEQRVVNVVAQATSKVPSKTGRSKTTPIL